MIYLDEAIFPLEIALAAGPVHLVWHRSANPAYTSPFHQSGAGILQANNRIYR